MLMFVATMLKPMTNHEEKSVRVIIQWVNKNMDEKSEEVSGRIAVSCWQ